MNRLILKLPQDIADAMSELTTLLPMEAALSCLKLPHAAHEEVVIRMIAQPAISCNTALIAGIWIYAGDIWKSHTVSQTIEDATGSWWHGIVHRLEGDFYNSRYWMQKVAGHPLLTERPELDPISLVNAVESAKGDENPDIVTRQREEWIALFEWCANQK